MSPPVQNPAPYGEVAPPKSQHDLSWELLLEALSSRCNTSRGAAQARTLALLPTREAAEKRQSEISEARALEDQSEPLPFGGISDVEPALLRSEKGGILTPPELCDIARTLAAGSRLRRHILARAAVAKNLAEHAERLAELGSVTGPIEDAFDEHGALRDNASPALGGLRQRVNQLLAELGRRTDSLLNEAHIAPFLQDRFVTQREDRYVVPLRADSRTRVRGIVHGTSASGATVFVEPEEIIDLNNRLKLAQLEVEEEERRILAALSQSVEQAAPEIAQNLELLALLDTIDAAARLSSQMRAGPVSIVPTDGRGPTGPGIDLRHARHPLMALSTTKVIANDLTLGLGGTLVISGPNAGGKTVALKLIGLCALMVHAGLHLPVQEGSTMPWFSRVLTDVGDDQSLERSLSTFSAHVMNLCGFLQVAGPGTLILIDELAVGTDPDQGAALAQGVLEAMARARATVLVTTHYDRLKSLAAIEPAVFKNASVGYDLQKLAPTYRLNLGIPGASLALSVADRLGLPSAIIERARGLLDEKQTGVERLLQALADEREQAHKLRAQADEHLRSAVSREVEAHALEERARVTLRRAQQRSHDETLDTLRAARRELDTLRQSLREQNLRAQKAESPEAAREAIDQGEYQRQKQRLAELTEQVQSSAPQKEGPRGRQPEASELTVGRKVFVRRLGGIGSVVSEPVRGKVVVQVGALRLSVEVAELLFPEGAERSERAPRGSRRPSDSVLEPPLPLAAPVIPPRTPDATIDLRGERMPVAIARAEKFVDDALREARPAVFILHGHGTGILRQSVRGHFASFPGIRRIRPADPQDGGDGVTVVELDV